MAVIEKNIFPIIRDSAPVIERIRERRQSSDNVANELGELVGKIVKSDSDEEKRQTREELLDGMRSSLAEELGVEEDDLSPGVFEDFASDITSLTEADVLSQSTIDELDIDPTVVEEESEDESETGLFDDDDEETSESESIVEDSSEDSEE